MTGNGGVSPEGAAADDAQAEVLALMYRRENRPGHVCHVSHLALQLFDQLTSLHQLAARERLILAAAAHLHDIGRDQDMSSAGHHKESARLIREHPWKNFTAAEVELIAQVARYHRKALPDLAHEEFRRLSESDRHVVLILAAFLRLADSLDRGHGRAITNLRVEIQPNALVLHLEAAHPLIREIRAASKKSDLATAVFQREIVFMHGEEILKPTAAPDESEA